MGSKNTRLFITYREYGFSTRSPIKGNFYIAIRGNVTVGNIIQLLVHRNSRDRYQLNSNGSGCRFWCLTVMGDLEQANYVARGSKGNIENNIQVLHSTYGNTWVPYPLVQGRFY
ncbi:hypothetical protein B0H12DRAFT_757031 [Mycena haematopus]|nr:hypothetical protein B0H12DRAFT_757031 [Mycena haematopus]